MTKPQFIAIGWNMLFLCGAACVAFGLWLAWPPLGYIFAGSVVMLLGYGGGFEQAMKGRRR